MKKRNNFSSLDTALKKTDPLDGHVTRRVHRGTVFFFCKTKSTPSSSSRNFLPAPRRPPSPPCFQFVCHGGARRRRGRRLNRDHAMPFDGTKLMRLPQPPPTHWHRATPALAAPTAHPHRLSILDLVFRHSSGTSSCRRSGLPGTNADAGAPPPAPGTMTQLAHVDARRCMAENEEGTGSPRKLPSARGHGAWQSFACAQASSAHLQRL